MSDRDALLLAIAADPAEDTHRLVFADWLEENGEPARAEFVRVQCGVGSNRSRCCQGEAWVYNQFGERTDCHRCRSTGERDRELLFLHCRDWLRAELPSQWMMSHWSPNTSVPYFVAGPNQFVNVGYARGFVSRVELPTAAFLNNAEALFQAHPITEVWLTDREPRMFGSLTDPAYTWDTDARDRESPSTIPNALWRYVGFLSAVQAREWLSNQCVDYGRKLVKLPQLKRPPISSTTDKTQSH